MKTVPIWFVISKIFPLLYFFSPGGVGEQIQKKLSVRNEISPGLQITVKVANQSLIEDWITQVMANIAVQRIKRELKEVLNSDEVIVTFKIQFF